MRKGVKIAVIGGGSSYTPELVEGLIKNYQSLPVKQLWLTDIEAGREKMEIAGNLARRMIAKAELPIEVTQTLKRKEALIDADFVITQFRIGLLDARVKDEKLPLKHGILGQETTGPGGFFKALRTIPVVLDVCRDMEELCPDAWLINFANPAGIITEAVLRHSNIKKAVGLCNVPVKMERAVAKLLNVHPSSRIHIDFAGLNHMVFGLSVSVDGVDVTQKIHNLLTAPQIELMKKDIKRLGWEPEFIKELEALPSPYYKYYIKTEDIVKVCKTEAAQSKTRAEVVKEIEKDLFTLYKDRSLAVKPHQLEERGGAYYSEAAVRLITSIYTDKGDIQAVNTRNNGAIKSLPSDSAVEVSCFITKDGPVPCNAGKLPSKGYRLIQELKEFEEKTVSAAVSGDVTEAVKAMYANPLVPSLRTSKQLVKEMMEAHREHLPQFFHIPGGDGFVHRGKAGKIATRTQERGAYN